MRLWLSAMAGHYLNVTVAINEETLTMLVMPSWTWGGAASPLTWLWVRGVPVSGVSLQLHLLQCEYRHVWKKAGRVLVSRLSRGRTGCDEERRLTLGQRVDPGPELPEVGLLHGLVGWDPGLGLVLWRQKQEAWASLASGACAVWGSLGWMCKKETLPPAVGMWYCRQAAFSGSGTRSKQHHYGMPN